MNAKEFYDTVKAMREAQKEWFKTKNRVAIVRSKVLTDVREWLHNHHPSWQRAMVYFSHYRLGKTHTDAIRIERGQLL